MADEAEDEVLELTDEVIDEQDQDDQTDQGDDQTGEPGEDEGEEETVISFGDDEAAPASGEGDTPLIKHLRAQLRERDKQLAEIRKTAPPQQIDPGPKPTLESCEWDEERFETELDAWKAQKAKAESQQSEAQRQQEQAREQWQNELRGYETAKAKLSFPDVQDAEDAVTTVLDQVQQTVIIKAAENPAQVIYALGKHPARLDALSKITDPLKLAAAVARLEGALQVTTRKKAPAPERIARGNASVSATAADKELERLEKEADRTGDRSKLIAYKRSLKLKP